MVSAEDTTKEIEALVQKVKANPESAALDIFALRIEVSVLRKNVEILEKIKGILWQQNRK